MNDLREPVPTIHATAVLLGEIGILLRGPSGSGKSTTAVALIDHFAAQGRFSALVADDRVILEKRNGRIVARPPAQLSGLVEMRGLGIVAVPNERAAVIGLVVDLVAPQHATRVPNTVDRAANVLGVILPRLAIAAGPACIVVISQAIQVFCEARGFFLDTCVCSAR